MQTLGIDLAADPAKTAAATIDWGEPGGRCDLIPGGDDASLIAAMANADAIGIDAPFGWPVDFVSAVLAHSQGRAWPHTERERMRYRLTDRMVRQRLQGIIPLSVSSDLIAVTAMRCVALIDRWEQATGERVDRAGSGRLAEVYPAAALATWGYPHRGYKGRRNLATLEPLIDRVVVDSGIDVSSIDRWTDDIFDAFVAALIARSKTLGNTAQPRLDQLDVATVEGWIHVPEAGSLQDALR